MPGTYPVGLTRLEGEALALSTSLASLGAYPNAYQVILYNPSTDFRAQVNPTLLAAYIYDNSQTGVAKWIDVTRVLNARGATGTLTYLDDLTTSDRLLLCFADVTGGFRVVMTASVNGTASNMTGSYWNGAWTSLAVTDGTDTGASLAQSGSVTWTAPTDAIMHPLGGPNHKYGMPYVSIDSTLTTNEVLTATDTGITMSADPSSLIVAGDYLLFDTEVVRVVSSSATGNLLTVIRGVLGSTAATHANPTTAYIYNINGSATVGFWVECKWNAAMDADTEIANIWALSKDSNRGYFRAGVDYPLSLDRRNVGAIEALLAAGTDTLQVTWCRVSGV